MPVSYSPRAVDVVIIVAKLNNYDRRGGVTWWLCSMRDAVFDFNLLGGGKFLERKCYVAFVNLLWRAPHILSEVVLENRTGG